MVDLHHLSIGAPAPYDQRIYPLHIYTLGRFSVTRGIEPIRFARKAQHRPLQLLKALIALGGREVGSDRLGMALWPESEGDTAYNAFEITLHRLRKLIGIENALMLSNGLLTLDNQRCWVDVWAFEQAVSHAETLLKSPLPNPDELASISSRVLTLTTVIFWA
jgi:DNA-binding SARP family transcriptional activator